MNQIKHFALRVNALNNYLVIKNFISYFQSLFFVYAVTSSICKIIIVLVCSFLYIYISHFLCAPLVFIILYLFLFKLNNPIEINNKFQQSNSFNLKPFKLLFTTSFSYPQNCWPLPLDYFPMGCKLPVFISLHYLNYLCSMVFILAVNLLNIVKFVFHQLEVD